MKLRICLAFSPCCVVLWMLTQSNIQMQGWLIPCPKGDISGRTKRLVSFEEGKLSCREYYSRCVCATLITDEIDGHTRLTVAPRHSTERPFSKCYPPGWTRNGTARPLRPWRVFHHAFAEPQNIFRFFSTQGVRSAKLVQNLLFCLILPTQ